MTTPPSPQVTSGSGGSGLPAVSQDARPPPSRRARPSLPIVVLAILVGVALLLAGFLVISQGPSPPTEVTVTSTSAPVDYTNLPGGDQSPNMALETDWAWLNSTAEQPQSFGAPPGSSLFLDIVIQFEPGQGADNCSVNGVSVSSPFSIASVQGDFGAPAGLRANPFPLNFSGQTMLNNTPALLALNVTLPAQAGSYAPSFVLRASCETYSP